MEVIAEIRRRHLVSKESISSIARDLKLSRQTVRKHLHTETEPVYARQQQPAPKLGEFQATLEGWLQTERHLPKSQRRTARRLFEGLQAEGYRGAYDSVQRCVKQWKASQIHPAIKDAFVPLVFAPGEACQFDWSHEHAEIDGVMQTIKVAHFRLTYSRQMFVIAYPRETQEMVFDAHNRAFAFFGGVPTRMVYDNLKAVVDAILVGKERQFNRRFLTLANHYLFEPVACTPASGWEKGQVENQVGNVREWLFTPLARFTSFAALNDWLATRCRELALRKHPSEPGRTIAECFVQEGPSLRAVVASFNGYVEQMLRVSSTCLVRVDRNRYSVPADHAGKAVSVRLTADRVRIVAEGQLIAEHECKLPLATTRDIQSGEVQWRGQGVINPFGNGDALVDLAAYPRLRRYLEQHKTQIARRHCAQKNPAGWYRTIDRITPALRSQPKLLIPDIKGEAHIVYEAGELYPHHNLYFVTSDTWDLRALQAVLLSSLSRLFVAIYSTKMRGGFLRFQAQYLRRIRLPHWRDVPDALREALRDAAIRRDLDACNRAVFTLYALTSDERAALGGNGA